MSFYFESDLAHIEISSYLAYLDSKTGDEKIDHIRNREKKIDNDTIVKTYGRKGKNVIDMNMKAVDAAIKSVEEVRYPKEVASTIHMLPAVPEDAPKFVKEVTEHLTLLLSQEKEVYLVL